MLKLMTVVSTLALGTSVASAAVVAQPLVSVDPLDVVGVSDGELFSPTAVYDDEFVDVTITLGGVERTLRLHAVNRRADTFQVWADREGGFLEPIEVDPPKTYQGRMVGTPGSSVAASIINGEISAYIVLDDGVWGIQPVGGGVHISYDAGDLIPIDARCGVDEGFRVGPRIDPDGQYETTSEAEVCVPAALIAFDADHEFFQWSGGEQETVDQIELVMNILDIIYHRDVLLGHVIGDMIIRTTPDDPYSGDIFNRFSQFQAHWNSQQQGIDRDLAHLFSGGDSDGVIGVAWLGTPCRRPDLSYGISISNFTDNIVARVALTAHEIGHNWSAGHCDGDDDCGIMCSVIGSCARDMENFGAASRAAIENYVSSVQRICLGDEECFDGDAPAPGIVFGNTTSGELGSLDALGRLVPVATPDFDTDGMAYDRNRKVFLLTDTRDRATLYMMRELDSRIFVVGPFVGASRVAGLAFDPNGNRLFGVDQAIGQLYLIEPQEIDDEFVALATPFGPEHGGLMGGLAYDEIENVLYAVDDSGGSVLYSIDTDTGMRTRIGSLGLQDCDGLCWRPGDQMLYTIDGITQSIYTVDKATGESTLVRQFRSFAIASTFGMGAGSEECVPDINGDGVIDALDFFAYLDLFAAGDPDADLTGSGDPDEPDYGVPDGVIDADDFFFFLDMFVQGCE